jgi:hypothetical protein
MAYCKAKLKSNGDNASSLVYSEQEMRQTNVFLYGLYSKYFSFN